MLAVAVAMVTLYLGGGTVPEKAEQQFCPRVIGIKKCSFLYFPRVGRRNRGSSLNRQPLADGRIVTLSKMIKI